MTVFLMWSWVTAQDCESGYSRAFCWIPINSMALAQSIVLINRIRPSWFWDLRRRHQSSEIWSLTGSFFHFLSFFVDLCHRRRDVHSRGDHRLLYFHCFWGLEEDTDWQNVMMTASHPSSHLIYKCKVASLLAKSSPKRPPSGDCITLSI